MVGKWLVKSDFINGFIWSAKLLCMFMGFGVQIFFFLANKAKGCTGQLIGCGYGYVSMSIWYITI
jgi:hypothetical protein